MITIHEKTTTYFNNLGLGALLPSLCNVTEELNGLYELEMEHPYDERGKWKRIEKERIILASTPRGKQPFRIYHVNPTMEGITVNARHIFYDLLDNLCLNLNITGTAQTVLNAVTASLAYTTPFTLSTDIIGTGTVTASRTNPIAVLLGMDEDKDSFIKSFGGEIVRDGFDITMKNSIGQDRGVAIRYGKNLIGLTVSEDISEVATRILPIGKDGLQGSYVDSQYINSYVYPKIYVLEDNQLTTLSELQQAALELLESGIDLPKVNIKADFLELSKTEEYKEYAILEKVYLGDVVTVSNTKMGFHKKAKVISYEWDCLLERYNKVELGDFVADLTTSVTSGEKSFATAVSASTEAKQVYGLISGKVTIDADGQYVCVDGTSPNDATKLFHFGSLGLRHSSTGASGVYKTIIDPDGNIFGGTDGVGLQYDWDGTRLGIKRDDEATYQYTNLKGDKGEQGIQGIQGIQGPPGNDGLTTSVNGVTHVGGAISLTQDNIPEGTTNKNFTATEKTKLSGIATGANKTVIANNLTETVAGKALDAVQGKALAGQISSIRVVKTARFVVGTSTAGWTSADCDYLCDGTADQTEINAAITALPATGGEVVILDGTYNITAKIDVTKNNVSIRGNGNATILKRMYNSIAEEGVITLSNVSNCSISNLQIAGNVSSYVANYNMGISLVSSSNNTITGVKSNSSKKYGIYLESSNNSNRITNNECNSNGWYGVYVSTSNNNIIANNVCIGCGSGGVLLEMANGNIVVDNTCNQNQSSGIMVKTSSFYNVLAGNICNNNSRYGISLATSSDNNAITGNVCSSNTIGILLNACSRNVITGNSCMRGTGVAGDYTASQYTIYLVNTTNNYNLISSNLVMGKDVAIAGGTSNTAINNKFS